MTAPVIRFDGTPPLVGVAVSGDAPERGGRDKSAPGQLWQRLGSASGPVRGQRRYAVGSVVPTYRAHLIRAIEVETRDEHSVSRVRSKWEREAGYWPSCEVYAAYREPSV